MQDISLQDHEKRRRLGADDADEPIAVLVLGMCNNATWAISGVLNSFGVCSPGEQISVGVDNQKELLENKHVVAFHERVFAHLNSSWEDPLPLSSQWRRSPTGRALGDELFSLVMQEFGANPIFLVNDPRMCQLAPLWLDVLTRLNRRTACVLPGCHPLEAATSLHERNGLSRSQALVLWLKHVLSAERYSRGYPRSFVLHDELLNDWRGVARKISSELDLIWARDPMRIQDEVDQFLETEFRHHAPARQVLDASDKLHQLVAETWKAFQALSHNPDDRAAMESMDRVGEAYWEAASLFGPLVTTGRRLPRNSGADLLAKLEVQQAELLTQERVIRECDQSLGELRAAVAQRDATIIDLDGRLAAATTELQDELKVARGDTERAGVALRRIKTQLESTHRSREEDLHHRLELAYAEVKARDDQLRAMYASSSWRALRPIRGLVRVWRGELSGKQALDMAIPSMPRWLLLLNRWLGSRKAPSVLPEDRSSSERQVEGGGTVQDTLARPSWADSASTENPDRRKKAAPVTAGTRFPLPGYAAAMSELAGTTQQTLGVTISVVIPTYNAGAEFFWLLKKLRAQRGIRTVEIIVVDSGSSDNTVKLAESMGCKIILIDKKDFSHSYTRNLGADSATGDLLLFTVQDAYPVGDYWLHALAMALLHPQTEEDRLAAVSCAEFPRADSELFYNALIDIHYKFLGCHAGDKIGRMTGADSTSLRSQGQISDIACMITRILFLKYRYHGRYAEDLLLGIKLITDGYRVGMLSSVRAIHSHCRSSGYYVRRVFVDVVFLADVFSDFGVPRASSIVGTSIAGYALQAITGAWQPLQYANVEHALDALLEQARAFRPPSQIWAPVGDGFGFAPLGRWIEAFARRDGRQGQVMTDVDVADAEQLRNMFVDRLQNLKDFAARVFSGMDERICSELTRAADKTLAMSVGASVAFIYLNAQGSAAEGGVAELKAMLLEGI